MGNTIYSLLIEQIKQRPNKICILDENRALTGKDFIALIDTIGIKIPDRVSKVGIMMEHSVEMIAAIFAALKKGAAYVPVEPFFPQERIAFMMQNAGVNLVLTNEIHINKLSGLPYLTIDQGLKITDVQRERKDRPEDLAYVLYTSGSTGKPKGVSVRNENVCHYIRAFRKEFKPSVQDVMLQYSVCSFDIFVEEVFATLCSGAVLAIPAEQTKKDMTKLMAFVEEKQITIISGFPYLLLEMNSFPKLPSSLRLLISGGDVLRASYVKNLLNQVEVYNTYGPSETTVCATYYRCNDVEPLADGTYPIGKGILGAKVEILNEQLMPVEKGKIGEICISGGGVSAGYIGNNQKENEAFVHRQDGSTLYRSGDLGYFLPDGEIAFLRRMDTQVMILGKRVEPTEVEAILCNCSGIKAACVRPYTDEQKLAYMVAYVVLNQAKMRLSTLKKEMARFLPHYMIPEFFVEMQSLPLNENGKVNVKKLPVVMKEGEVV